MKLQKSMAGVELDATMETQIGPLKGTYPDIRKGCGILSKVSGWMEEHEMRCASHNVRWTLRSKSVKVVVVASSFIPTSIATPLASAIIRALSSTNALHLLVSSSLCNNNNGSQASIIRQNRPANVD